MTPVTWSTYDGVRDDVAPWLREVPAEWRFEKAKWFLSYCKQLNDHGTIDNVLSLTLRGVVNNDPDNPEGLVPKDYRTYQVFEAGDLVFKLIDLENVRTSRVGLVHERGIMSSAYIRVVPSAQWNPRFLYYFYFHLYEAEVFNKIGSGVRSTLGQADLLDLPIPVIGRDIQDKIVGFLDEKCAKVDEAVRIKEEQIALLRERRQILIQEAVTRGLNPDAPMKDSGIDWIGQIPEHWEQLANKHIFRLKKTLVGKQSSEYELLSLTLRGIIKRDMENPEGKFPAEFDTYQEVSPGDFVFCHFDVEETPRTVGLSDFFGMITGAYTVYSVASGIDPRFLLHFYVCADTDKKMRSLYKGLRNTIPKEAFGAFKTPLPPLNEQRAIVAFIDEASLKIEDAIFIKQRQIAKLKEYKSTLINAAVTGKIKVA